MRDDDVVLKFLLIVLLSVLFFTFVFMPLNQQVSALVQKRNELSSKYDDILKAVEIYNSKQEEINQTKQDYAQLSLKMPLNLDEKFVLYDVLTILKSAGAKFKELPVSNRNSSSEQSAFFYTVKCNAAMSYSAFKQMISSAKNFYTLYNIKNINLSSLSDKEINASFEINFFGYKDELAPERLWENRDLPVGKENLFSQGKPTFSVNAEQSDKKDVKNIKRDFSVILSTINSPTSSVILEKSGEGIGIRGANRAIENGVIRLVKKDGSYGYYLKTDGDYFPKDKEYQTFKPIGEDIVIFVYSSPRKYKEDKNTALINIINETDKKVRVFVYNDSQKNPRAIFIKKGKDIYIETGE